MTAEERKKGEEHLYREERYASRYEINMLRCIFCGYCEDACPTNAIVLEHHRAHRQRAHQPDRHVPLCGRQCGGVPGGA